MSARVRAVQALFLIAAVVVLVVILSGGGGSRRVAMVLPQDPGLINGSDVRVGGVPVGSVKSIELTRSGQVRIAMDITSRTVRLHPDASAQVEDLDLLGQKYVELDPGSAREPVVEQLTIPAARVGTPTDLDQVLDVLDPTTAQRLGILINATGEAIAGRSADFARLLSELPPSLGATTKLLDRLVADNHTLAELITHSDRFLTTMVARSGRLRAFVNSASAAAATFASRSTELGQTLERAPATLSTLRSFLAQLQATAGPLRPAAENLSRTAPQLAATLDQLTPFRSALAPVLTQATQVAPALGRLGTGGTPVVRRSVPAVAALERLAQSSSRLMPSLLTATPNLIGILEDWGRTIQTRDARGHMFHGKVTMGLSLFQDILEAVMKGQTQSTAVAHHPVAAVHPDPLARPAPATAPSAAPQPESPVGRSGRAGHPAPGGTIGGVQRVIATVGQTLGALLGPHGQQTPPPPSGGAGGSLQSLLGYLLKP